MVSTICTASSVNINLPANSILLIDYPQFTALTVGASRGRIPACDSVEKSDIKHSFYNTLMSNGLNMGKKSNFHKQERVFCGDFT